MAFIDPFEKITEDVNALFRPQREWVERRGLFLVAGHFLSGIGAGTWLFALLIGSKPALVVGLIIVAAGGLAHLLFLGCWQRFWRMVWRPQTSWISRGLLSMGLFSISGLIYILLAYGYLLAGLDSGLAMTMLVLSLLGMSGIFVYKGFVYTVSRAIPFWDTPLLPVLYIVYALRGGIAILLIMAAFSPALAEVKLMELIDFWIILSTAVMVLFYLAVMRNAGVTAKQSVSELLAGRTSWAFYLGTVLFGILVPLALGGAGYFAPLSLSLLAVVGISSLIGDFYIKYCINKAGLYLPIVGEFPAH